MTNNITNVVPFNEVDKGVDLNLAIQQAQKMTTILQQMGIEEATFKTGTYFKQKADTTTLVAEGILVQQDQDVTIVAFSNKGSSRENVVEQVGEKLNVTQKIKAAFVGCSQAHISNLENDEGKE